MKQEIDITTWKRKQQYLFFKDFEEPFYGVCVDMDITHTYKEAKEKGVSFFLLYFYKMLKAVNTLESFRYRIEDNKVVLYDTIHGSATIRKADNTFVFIDVEYDNDFDIFAVKAKKEIDKALKADILLPCVFGEQTILTSTVPWIRFTSMSHARMFSSKGSAPRMTFGKVSEENGRMIMPLSIHVHHALTDGYDIGCFIDLYQEILNK